MNIIKHLKRTHAFFAGRRGCGMRSGFLIILLLEFLKSSRLPDSPYERFDVVKVFALD